MVNRSSDQSYTLDTFNANIHLISSGFPRPCIGLIPAYIVVSRPKQYSHHFHKICMHKDNIDNRNKTLVLVSEGKGNGSKD